VPGRRSMEVEWVQSVRDRCIAQNTAFFLQWHKGDTGRLLDGRTWDEFPARLRF
jgi:protein gp37